MKNKLLLNDGTLDLAQYNYNNGTSLADVICLEDHCLVVTVTDVDEDAIGTYWVQFDDGNFSMY